MEDKFMKKILSAVLATAMLSTAAMAAGLGTVASPYYGDVDVDGVTSTTDNYVAAGSTLYIKSANFTEDISASTKTLTGVDTAYEFNDDYFTVTTKRFSKTPGLVSSVTFGSANDGTTDSEALVIKLKSNSTLTGVKKPNLSIDEIKVRAKQGSDTEVVGSSPVTYLFDNREVYEWTGIGHGDFKVITANETLDENSMTGLDGTLDIVRIADFDGREPYTEASVDTNSAYLYGRVYDKDQFKVYVNELYNMDVVKAYDDTDAELDFVNVEISGLNTAWTIDILANEEDAYIYEVGKNGKLEESSLEWNDNNYSYSGRIRTSTQYVISDIELDVDVKDDEDTDNDNDNDSDNDNDNNDDGDTNNPDTGANDVVGVAVALAVVSLVAAGAVSLKK